MVMMRLSRTCYDKPHRCPGWAGGGWKTARTDRCDNGSIRTKNDGYPGEHRSRFGHCTECNTVTWPVLTRWLDPVWLAPVGVVGTPTTTRPRRAGARRVIGSRSLWPSSGPARALVPADEVPTRQQVLIATDPQPDDLRY